MVARLNLYGLKETAFILSSQWYSMILVLILAGSAVQRPIVSEPYFIVQCVILRCGMAVILSAS